jgi:hypothetical protein
MKRRRFLILSYYKVVIESTLHLVLKLRGGGSINEPIITCNEKIKIENHSTKINAAEGATTLQGESNKQEFGICNNF